MKYVAFAVALLIAPIAEAQSLSDLGWLKGCWRTERPNGAVVTEVWAAPPMPALVGYSFTVREGEIRDWEQTRIEIIDGVPHFIAMPRGAPPVRFRMRAPIAPGSASFENPEHDFPQRVSYVRDGNRLRAVVSASDGSNALAFDYRRIRCPSVLRP